MGELLANVGMRWEQRRRQCDGKQSGTGQTVGWEQHTVRRDGRRREQKPKTGRVGNSWPGTKNHMVYDGTAAVEHAVVTALQ